MGQVNITECAATTELYCHYDRQTNRQDCYIELDTRDGSMQADYNAEIGNAVPSEVYHGQIRRYGIPLMRGETANELMREIAPLAERIVEGASDEWDGSNMVTHLDDDAYQAEMELTRHLESAEGDLDEQDAGDWLYEIRQELMGKIREGADLGNLATELEGDALADGVVLNRTERYLESLKEMVETDDNS